MKTIHIFCLLIVSFNLTVANAAESLPERPNILFIILDDLNDAVSGMGGHPQAKTPNVERLMERGVRFTNAQCNSASVCAFAC